MVERTAESLPPDGVRDLYEKDQEILRKTFFKNEELLRAMGNIMLGVCKSDVERSLLKSAFADPAVFSVVKRRFLPSLDDPMALGQAKDEWSGIEVDIAGRSPEQVRQSVEYKAHLIAMTRQAVELLRTPTGSRVDLDIDETSLANDPMGSRIMARANFVKNVNQQITFLWIAGNQKKEETPQSSAAAKANKANPSGKPGVRG